MLKSRVNARWVLYCGGHTAWTPGHVHVCAGIKESGLCTTTAGAHVWLDRRGRDTTTSTKPHVVAEVVPDLVNRLIVPAQRDLCRQRHEYEYGLSAEGTLGCGYKLLTLLKRAPDAAGEGRRSRGGETIMNTRVVHVFL